MINKKIAVITDSTCDLSQELLDEYNIPFVSLRVIYKDAEYRDRREITPIEIYDRLKDEIPKSSLPHSDDAIKIFDELAEQGYTDAIMLVLSSGLSGTYNMLRLIVEQYTKMNIVLIDTKAISAGLGFMAIEAAKAIRDGKTMEETLEIVKETRRTMEGYFVVKTLEYLRKGGRIGKVEGTVGTFLHIKPIITIGQDGVYHTMEKLRGRKKAVAHMTNRFIEKYRGKRINLAVLHGNEADYAKMVLETLKNNMNIKEILFEQISPVLGMHTGPGLIGLIGYEV